MTLQREIWTHELSRRVRTLLVLKMFANLGGIAALGALLLGADRKSALPFGPSLAVGAVVATFWGTQIAQAYLNRLG